MADDLHGLGLYATSNGVRRGSVPLTKGVEHVRDYCLPNILRGIERLKQRAAEAPPIPGTWGATAVLQAEARRDELQAFVDDWWAYDMATEAAA